MEARMSFNTSSTANTNSTLSRYSRAEDQVRESLRQHGVTALRVAIGIIFLWFGILKVTDQSPVVAMIQTAFPFMPHPFFVHFLGAWEIAIGIGLISGVALRLTLALFLGQMTGTLSTLVMAPKLCFMHGNVLLLTTEGEFVAKNIVFITAGLVVAAYSLKPISAISLHRRSLVATIISLL
jgi:uncharacterized membrane protein YkgB